MLFSAMSILISPEIRWQIENRKMENNKYYFHLKIDGKLLLQVIYTVYDKDYTLRKKSILRLMMGYEEPFFNKH